jgi:hypothetical protein
MTSKQKRFLDQRLREHAKVQPEIRQLKRILLRLGGWHLVAPPTSPDENVPHLVQSGFVMPGPAKLKVMGQSACHLNASRLWLERQRGIVAIGTGYALSEDGLWGQHTWAVRREGLVETTCSRKKYFGVVLWSVLADGFAKGQCLTNGVACCPKLEQSGTGKYHPGRRNKARALRPGLHGASAPPAAFGGDRLDGASWHAPPV